jgi:pilus assembly protein CpaF
MTAELLPLAYANHQIADLDPAARRLALRELAINETSADDVASSVASAADVIDGFGILSTVMADPSVTDILVNGPGEIWVERDGELEPAGVSFRSPEELLSLIRRLLNESGVSIDVMHPIADARLRDGSRMHVVLPPAAPDGPLVSIRRFPQRPWSLDDLVGFGMLRPDEARALASMCADRRTIAISGGTGTGKTTLLNALLGTIDASERVVLIEETPELRPTCSHSVSLLTRSANLEGAGVVDARELLRAALRMRPDRIVVGEVRGAEASIALQAMSTGHAGSMVTIHADSPSGALERMTRLALQASPGATESGLRETVDRCFEIVVQLDRNEGRRRVVAIEEPG